LARRWWRSLFLHRGRIGRKSCLHIRRHTADWLGVQDQIGHFNAVFVNIQDIAILQFNLAALLQRNVVEYDSGHIATVSNAAFTVPGDMYDRLQARNGALIVRQHQVIVRSASNGASRRIKIAAALRRLMAGFIGNYCESHSVFLLELLAFRKGSVLITLVLENKNASEASVA
jgi:hypothetical protein